MFGAVLMLESLVLLPPPPPASAEREYVVLLPEAISISSSLYSV